jgi:2-C-methyl-D-erythritol 4-phosphate cytidylyltransferase
MSIFNGLEVIEKETACENVIIHDAARPLISEALIAACFRELDSADGVMPVLPVKDTCYQSMDGKTICSFIPRSQLFAGQAPEAFRLKPYLELHRTLPPEVLLEISGSSELAYKHGLTVAMIPGEEKNFKITTQDDLKLLEKYLQCEDKQ